MGAFAIWVASTAHGAPPFWRESERVKGFMLFTVLGVLIAPWMALAAVVRQKDASARHQAIAFDLERSELERQALDGRLHRATSRAATTRPRTSTSNGVTRCCR